MANDVILLGEMRVGYDTFRGCIMIEQTAGQWRRVQDHDLTQLRETLQRAHRFEAVGKEMMRDALELVAHRYEFDSAIIWLNQQQWDDTPRVDRFLHDYCGCPLDEYTIAVSRYIWSGLAARVLEPGCQLDMVVAMLSKEQGFYKSSALRELAPDPEYFTDGVDLHKDNEDFKRLIKGKLVCEIAELAGLNTASAEHVKRVITRRDEEWIEKWQTLPTRYARRCMLFATTNNEQFLPLDETGQRRWLPVEVGHLLREHIKRDRDHLWAEGANIYRVRKQLGLPGVEFEAAESLAKGRHGKHEQADVWESAIALWLETPIGGPNSEILPAPGTRPFTAAEVLAGALLMNKDRMDGKAEKRVSRTLKLLGYESRTIRIGTATAKRWIKCG